MSDPKELFVSNLHYGVSCDDLKNAFQPFGTIVSARIVTDKETGHSRGFGFVEMESATEAQAAIAALNGTEFSGRILFVKEARPQTKNASVR